MSILGPYTGNPNKSYSYLFGPHWRGMKGYRVVKGSEQYQHRFGGETWKVPLCKNCNAPLHQILTLDLKDPRLEILRAESLEELPLVSCLNCSTSWEPQIFKVSGQKKEIKILSQNDSQGWISEQEDRVPAPLPKVSVMLNKMHSDDIPVDEQTYDRAFYLLGDEYICRLLGAPLYATDPIDRECPICKKEMTFIATFYGESCTKAGKLMGEVDLFLGEMYLYFLLCRDCLVIKTESQGT